MEDKCASLKPPINKALATQLLKLDLQGFEECVKKSVTYSGLTKQQFSALVAFSFNLGCEYLQKSKLVELLNKGDVKGAAAEFLKNASFNGKTYPGLVKRRTAERKLFCSRKACR